MAINKQTFRKRALTAIIFVVIMLTGLLLNPWTFILLFFIILIGCYKEFVPILKSIFRDQYYYYLPFSLLYILMPVMMMLDLGTGLFNFVGNISSDLILNPLFPCAIIFSIWINDTMAYIVGSMIGKTPFSSISPKKTWEGTIGGAILCVLVIGLLSKLPVLSKLPDAQSVKWYNWIIIATLAAIFGTIGDLFESKLKRMAGLKDSGSILPGHGGFLDRFDSLLVATPVIWLYIRVFLIKPF